MTPEDSPLGEIVTNADVESLYPKAQRIETLRAMFGEGARSTKDALIQEGRTTLKEKADRAFANGKINERTYKAIVAELRKPVPKMRVISALLEGEVKLPEKAAPEAPKAEAPKAKAPKTEAPKVEAEVPVVPDTAGLSSEAKRSAYRSHIMDALDADRISEKVYDDLAARLKDPSPDYAAIERILQGRAGKRPKPVKEPKPITETQVKDLEKQADEWLKKPLDETPVREPEVGKEAPKTEAPKTEAPKEAPKTEKKPIQHLTADQEAKLQAKFPNGPFSSEKGQVVGSKNMDPNVVGFVRELLNHLGLGDLRVFINHPEDIATDRSGHKLYGDYQYGIDLKVRGKKIGSLRMMGPEGKDFSISIQKNLPGDVTVEALGHEVGHMIERVAFNNAPMAERLAVINAYGNWVAKTENMPAAELAHALRNRAVAELAVDGFKPDTVLDPKYWKGFSEWFADQVSRWVTTNKQPMSLVDWFFKSVADKIRQLASVITGRQYLPDPAVVQFLERMGPDKNWGWKGGKLRAKPSAMSVAFDPEARAELTPDEQVANDKHLLRSYGSFEANKPSPTKEMMQRGREVLSRLNAALRRGVLSGMTANQVANEYGEASPSLYTRDDLLNKEGAALRRRTNVIEQNIKKFTPILMKYSVGERQRIYRIFHDTTVSDVEVLSDRLRGWEPTAADKATPTYELFQKLPADVKEVYRGLREAYHNDAEAGLELLRQFTTSTEWQRIMAEWKNKRIRVYLPLFRDGDYWLMYKNANGEIVKQAFDTPAARTQAKKEAEAAGMKNVMPYNNFKEMNSSAPPIGFFTTVTKILNKAKVDEAIKDQIAEAFMRLLPSKSALHMTQKRAGTAGYELDPIKAYANIGTRQAMHLNRLEFAPQFQKVMESIREEISRATDTGKLNPDVAVDLSHYVEEAHKFANTPISNSMVAKAQYMGYMTYIGGNLSSALVTTTDIPLVAFPMLSGINGFGKAFSAMTRASRLFYDYHFHGGKQLPDDVKRMLEQSKRDGITLEHRAEDITEFKTHGIDRYLGMKARVDNVMNKLIGTADKFNREVTMMAAYDLHKTKLSSTLSGEELHQAAYTKAKRDVLNSVGEVFRTASPNITQYGLARMAMMFKRYGLNRTWLLSKTFRDAVKNEPPDVKKAALMQMLGFYGMAGLFAGVQGMPLVGWGETLAQLANNAFGDDETFDSTEAVKQGVGTLAYKGPINYYLNLNLSDRAGWDNMLWRDDEKRRSDVGFQTFAMEQLLGPSYSVGQDLGKAWDHFSEGRIDRGLEAMLPKIAGNVLKGVRYMTEGATTKDGIPIKQDINAYNGFMQMMGFAPADLAEIQKESSSRLGMVRKMDDRRRALTTAFVAARMSEDTNGVAEVLADIRAYNKRHPGNAISGSTLQSALMNYHRRLAQSVNGIYFRPKIRQEVMAAYPGEEEAGAEEE